MSVKRKSYSAEFKAKLVLEVLEGEKTINEIASAYEIIPKNLINWKQQFLENYKLKLACPSKCSTSNVYISPTC